MLRARLSTGQRFIAASGGCSYDGSNRTVTCPLGDLPNGASRSRGVTVEATQAGTVSARATASSATADLRPANNAQTESVTVRRSGRPRCTLAGGSGNDVIVGTTGNDVICAGAGNDTVRAGRGDDVVFGGAGNDILRGNEGSDRLFGGSGNNVLRE